MLVYVSKPDHQWGPAKNVNRWGRYQPKIDENIPIDQTNYLKNNENDDFYSENIHRTRF